MKEHNYLITIAVMLGIVSVILLSGCSVQNNYYNWNGENISNIQNSSNNQVGVENNSNIQTVNASDNQIVFIPPHIRGTCNIGEKCEIIFQIKNVGENSVYLDVGTYTETYNPKGINYYGSSSSYASLRPGELSNNLSVNAFANPGLDAGEYQIKIPIQVIYPNGTHFEETKFYLTGTIQYT